MSHFSYLAAHFKLPMKRSITLFLLALMTGAAQGQNISSALHLNEEREYKTKRPKQMVETKTSYGSDGPMTAKSVTVFDNAGMILTEEYFDENGTRTARLTRKNDTVNRRCLESKFERWGKTGYGEEITVYNYDASHFLIRITDQDGHGSVSRVSKIVNDDKGHPVEATLYDAVGQYGKETATYFYDRNTVVTAALDNDGNVIATDTASISFRDAHLYPKEGYLYNEHGDATKWVSRQFDGEMAVFEAEYIYDASGNCIDVVTYKMEPMRGGKPRKRKYGRLERQYTY